MEYLAAVNGEDRSTLPASFQRVIKQFDRYAVTLIHQRRQAFTL